MVERLPEGGVGQRIGACERGPGAGRQHTHSGDHPHGARVLLLQVGNCTPPRERAARSGRHAVAGCGGNSVNGAMTAWGAAPNPGVFRPRKRPVGGAHPPASAQGSPMRCGGKPSVMLRESAVGKAAHWLGGRSGRRPPVCALGSSGRRPCRGRGARRAGERGAIGSPPREDNHEPCRRAGPPVGHDHAMADSLRCDRDAQPRSSGRQIGARGAAAI